MSNTFVKTCFKPNPNYNFILDTDSYKISHPLQYPDGASELFIYFESRGSQHKIFNNELVFFGLQIIIEEYLKTIITTEMIDEAQSVIDPHGLGQSFQRHMWEHIVEKYEGKIPVTIRAVPEGSIVPCKNVLFTIHCKDPVCFPVASHIETMCMRVWSPCTTATKSLYVKKIILDAAEQSSEFETRDLFKTYYETGVPSPLLYKFHDFGARGADSYDTSRINGGAHQTSFLGTDTLASVLTIRRIYDEYCSGHSIDATEHSTMTALGPDGEHIQIEKMVDTFGDRFMFAMVLDGFNIYKAIDETLGVKLYDKIMAMNAVLVIRPDSGDPVTMVLDVLNRLDKIFGHTVNKKGYKVLNKVRIIQGDGLSVFNIYELVQAILKAGYSIDNVAFGMGGGLLQQQDRDWFKCAIKNSWMVIDGNGVNVYKNPITDPGKTSKKGRMTLMRRHDGSYYTVTELTDEQYANPEKFFEGVDALKTVYDIGETPISYTFKEIRLNEEDHLQRNYGLPQLPSPN